MPETPGVTVLRHSWKLRVGSPGELLWELHQFISGRGYSFDRPYQPLKLEETPIDGMASFAAVLEASRESETSSFWHLALGTLLCFTLVLMPLGLRLIRRSRAIYRHTITLSLEGEAYRSSARASDSRWLQAEMLGVTSNARLTLEATLTRLQAGEAWPVTSGPHWQALVREFEQLTATLSQPLKPVTLPVPAESEAGG